MLNFIVDGSGGNSLFPVGGAKPSKFPTKLSNFRQTPPFALEKAVFSLFIGQNFRKFVIFHEGGGEGGRARPAPPRFPPLVDGDFEWNFCTFIKLSQKPMRKNATIGPLAGIEPAALRFRCSVITN